MHDLTIRYTVEKTVNIQVEDFELTEQEIKERIDREIKKFVPHQWQEDVETEWVWSKGPKPKGSKPVPPDDYWVQTSKGEIASNGWIAVLREFPIPDGFRPGRPWKSPKDLGVGAAGHLERWFSRYWQDLPLHTGWFRLDFEPLKRMPGLEVRGEAPDALGHIILNGKLMGIVMPFLRNDNEDCFQFHKTKSLTYSPS